MGDHRSGTTLLYKLLDATGCFNIATAFHVILRDELLFHHMQGSTAAKQQELADLFAHKGLATRVFDGVGISPDMPEEYGFVLKGAGSRPQLTPGNAADLITFCKKIQFGAGNTRPLLLKNPWDYFLNFMVVKELFPTSKFIFIARHPTAVVNSQLRATRSLFQEKNEYVALVAAWYEQLYQAPIKRHMGRLLFSGFFDLGLRVVTRHVVKACEYFINQAAYLAEEDIVKIRYEDLCKTPGLVIDQILEMLGCEKTREPDYPALIQPRNINLLPEVRKSESQLSRKIKEYLAFWGYEASCE